MKVNGPNLLAIFIGRCREITNQVRLLNWISLQPLRVARFLRENRFCLRENYSIIFVKTLQKLVL